MAQMPMVHRPGAVFLSYSRGAADVARFVSRVLEPMLAQRLPHHGVVGELTVFRDEASLTPGTPWPEQLVDALRSAVVLVPVLTPEYFQRPWCLAEFYTMWGRLERLGVPCIEAVRFSDGRFFPPEAESLTWTDIEPYAFTRTHNVAPKRFRDAIDDLCKRAAALIHAAPDDPDWAFVEPTVVPRPLRKPTFGGGR